jgi:argininosuccinate lyase
VLWSSDEFGFITLDDAWSTGSSIMPQKKNPDFAELTRGKTGRVYGNLMAILTVLKGLPLAYNKDLQEDKEGLLDSLDTVSNCLRALCGMVSTMRVNSSRMLAAAQGGFMAATDLADFLVARGVAFRDAHAIIGRIVLAAEARGATLDELSLEELQGFSDAFTPEALELVRIPVVVDRRTSAGGTATACVREQLQQAKARLSQDLQDIAPGSSSASQ